MTGQVTALPRPNPDSEMNLIGLLVAVPIVLIALPLLPFLAVLWAFDRAFGGR